jgi:gamma-glutamylcyclotransferase (GGCT)/AIG2-like uncharacterized protein YtfP
VSTDVFVYGTLKPGQHRWAVLAPFTAAPEAADPASGPGRLFDTGYGWPAAVFDPRAADRVPGVVVPLHPASADEALAVLDDVEGVDSGLFRRVLIDVEGRACWAYHWPGPTGEFRRITLWS